MIPITASLLPGNDRPGDGSAGGEMDQPKSEKRGCRRRILYFPELVTSGGGEGTFWGC